jgi:signal transduction histidine kinase
VPCRAFCDYKRVEQVLMNLITNALKYTVQGRIVVRCRLDSQRLSSSEMLAIREVESEEEKEEEVVEDEEEDQRRRSGEMQGKEDCDGKAARGRVATRMDGESGEEDDCDEHNNKNKKNNNNNNNNNGNDNGASDEQYLCFEVEDTGIGISEEDQKNLFSVYTHIDGPTRMCSEKTGISQPCSPSLSISSRIVY